MTKPPAKSADQTFADKCAEECYPGLESLYAAHRELAKRLKRAIKALRDHCAWEHEVLPIIADLERIPK